MMILFYRLKQVCPIGALAAALVFVGGCSKPTQNPPPAVPAGQGAAAEPAKPATSRTALPPVSTTAPPRTVAEAAPAKPVHKLTEVEALWLNRQEGRRNLPEMIELLGEPATRKPIQRRKHPNALLCEWEIQVKLEDGRTAPRLGFIFVDPSTQPWAQRLDADYLNPKSFLHSDNPLRWGN